MKRSRIIVSWMLTLVLLVSCAVSGLVLPVAAETAVPSGTVVKLEDFEGDSYWSGITKWTAKGEVTADPLDATNKVLKLTSATSAVYNGAKMSEVAKGKVYALSIDFYGGTGIKLQFNESGKKVYGASTMSVSAASEWKTATYFFVTTSSSTIDGYLMHLTAPAGTCIDNVKLVELGSKGDINNLADGLLPGGDFEWTNVAAWSKFSASASPVVDDPTGADNKVMHFPSGYTATSGKMYQQKLGLAANTTYELSVDVYGDKIWAYLNSAKGISEGAGWVQMSGGTGTWKTVKHTFTTGASVTNDINVFGFGTSDGSTTGAYIDNVKIYKKVIAAESIELDQTALTMTVGDDPITLTPTVLPEDASLTEAITWTSSDETVATVVDGVVTAVGEGEATVTATSGTLSATCAVTVKPSAVYSISLDKTTAEMTVGEELQLNVTFEPEEAAQEVTWSSSDSTVATVTDGKVSAVSNGTVTITATAGTMSATCVITVKKAETTIPSGALVNLEDFEGDTTWTGISKWTAKGEVTTDPLDSTNKVLKLTSALSSTYNGTKISLTKGKVYALSMDFYGGTGIKLVFNQSDKKVYGASTLSVSAASAWKTATYFFVTTSSSTIDGYLMHLTAPAGTCIDNVRLVELGSKGDIYNMEDGLLSGGDFEWTNVAAWSKFSASASPVVDDPTGADNKVLHFPNGYTATTAKLYQQILGLKANTTYELSVDVYGDAIWAYLNEEKGIATGAGWIKLSGGGDRWKTVKHTFTTGDSVTNDINVFGFGTSDGSTTGVYIDNVRIQQKIFVPEVIKLNKVIVPMTLGDEPVTLTATVLPEEAPVTEAITWSSTDATVATVADGVITAVGEGTTTITAALGEISATCVVTVEQPKKTTITTDTATTGGKVVLNATEVIPGNTVSVTVQPENGYMMKPGSLKYITPGGTEVKILNQSLTDTTFGGGEGYTFEFTAPEADVTVTAEFVSIENTTFAVDTIGTSLHVTDGSYDGIRFLTRLNLATMFDPEADVLTVKHNGVDYEVVEIGSLLKRYEEDVELTMDNKVWQSKAYVKGGNMSLVDYTESYIDFTVVMMKGDSLSSEVFNARQYTARGYLILEDANGVQTTLLCDTQLTNSVNNTLVAGETSFLLTATPVMEGTDDYPEYFDFYTKAAADAVVPGLAEGFVPQGVDVWEEKGLILISGYFSTDVSATSMILAVDRKTGEYEGEYSLYYADGTPCTNHAGGLAVSEKNIWISSDKGLFRIPLSALEQAGEKGDLYFAEKINVPVNASFCNYADGMLWVGDFWWSSGGYSTDEYRHMTNRKGETYYAWSVGYRLTDETENEFSAEAWNETLSYATPDVVLSIQDRIQGFTVVSDQYIVLSQSYGRPNNSTIYLYEYCLDDAPHSEVTLNDTAVPVYFLDGALGYEAVTTMPMSEGVAVSNGVLYIVYESGAKKFLESGAENPTDNIWVLNP